MSTTEASGSSAGVGGPRPSVRPSRPPTSSPPSRRSRYWGRTFLAAAWIALQAGLILTAGERPDFAFGFRMFNESSTIEVHLQREVDSVTGHGTMLVDAPHGEWVAKDSAGDNHRFSVRDRVSESALTTYDVVLHASYGATAQLARLQAVIDDVVTHLDGDTETKQLVMTVKVRRNGRPPNVVTLKSTRR